MGSAHPTNADSRRKAVHHHAHETADATRHFVVNATSGVQDTTRLNGRVCIKQIVGEQGKAALTQGVSVIVQDAAPGCVVAMERVVTDIETGRAGQVKHAAPFSVVCVHIAGLDVEAEGNMVVRQQRRERTVEGAPSVCGIVDDGAVITQEHIYPRQVGPRGAALHIHGATVANRVVVGEKTVDAGAVRHTCNVQPGTISGQIVLKHQRIKHKGCCSSDPHARGAVVTKNGLRDSEDNSCASIQQAAALAIHVFQPVVLCYYASHG